MAISGVISTRIIVLSMIILSLFIGISSGTRTRLLVEQEHSDGNVARLMMHKLGFDKTKLEYYRERAARLLDAEPTRVAPDGPNPQHHG
ncbi:hypothetical protein CASFOL_019201 [Castilleja foliolosa]|uniref:Uncharacterized protein n=1 Tax=Castilleja foliolosa TaxID=1961234 RepID=A0ABD3D827_9LAMI